MRKGLEKADSFLKVIGWVAARELHPVSGLLDLVRVLMNRGGQQIGIPEPSGGVEDAFTPRPPC